jgi:CxxC motif-containing protein (DUF1111 family)
VQGGANIGLGPRFNSNQCSSCHSQPAVGGTSPSANVYPKIGPNPETNLCHTPALMTSTSAFMDLNRVQANLFSDLLVHHMGTSLADGVSQGSPGPDEFRSAPLWGVGQRIFLLHDGRTTDLLDAIEQHMSQGSDNPPLRDAVLPRTLERCPHRTDTHRPNRDRNFQAVLGIPIEDKRSRSGLIREGLTQLLHDPNTGGMPRNIEM